MSSIAFTEKPPMTRKGYDRNPHSQLLLSISVDGGVHLWDFDSGKAILRLEIQGQFEGLSV